MRGHECGVELFILMLSNSFLPPHEYSRSPSLLSAIRC